jgi:hypothetical protein
MPNSANKNKTRKSPNKFSLFFKQDPLLKAMNEGKILWGDLMMNEDKKRTKTRSASKSKSANSSSKVKSISPHWEEDVMEGFRTPDLRLRKGIYEHFPVIVNEVRPGVFEVKWNNKILKEWRQVRPESWDEYQEYEAWTEFRLLHSLRRHDRIYELMPAEKDDQIVLFKMRGEATAYKGPRLMRLNDIKEHFPVVWHKVDGRISETTYAIELRGDFKRRAHPTEINATQKALLNALNHSPAWKVLPAVGSEVAQIEMKHERGKKHGGSRQIGLTETEFIKGNNELDQAINDFKQILNIIDSRSLLTGNEIINPSEDFEVYDTLEKKVLQKFITLKNILITPSDNLGSYDCNYPDNTRSQLCKIFFDKMSVIQNMFDANKNKLLPYFVEILPEYHSAFSE